MRILAPWKETKEKNWRKIVWSTWNRLRETDRQTDRQTLQSWKYRTFHQWKKKKLSQYQSTFLNYYCSYCLPGFTFNCNIWKKPYWIRNFFQAHKFFLSCSESFFENVLGAKIKQQPCKIYEYICSAYECSNPWQLNTSVITFYSWLSLI